ncbi:uncharacterized protein LOC129744915 [Uranotaenia lowii]|uniref:uncharacterized protein LOC129744915 n=1 Tax=Uranotaenia lowii TaxID=190385 RepID=UPI00247A5F4A|nr:uncharacterized protein LOC129744915 [Uranotaenia lowii]
MPIVKSVDEANTKETFSLAKVLFGEDKLEEEETPEASPRLSFAEKPVDAAKTSKSSPPVSRTASDLGRHHSVRISRPSLVFRNEAMVQSLRKISQAFRAGSSLSSSESEFFGNDSPEVLEKLKIRHAEVTERFNKALAHVRDRIVHHGSVAVDFKNRQKGGGRVEPLVKQIDVARQTLSRQRLKLIAVYLELEQLKIRDAALDEMIKHIRLEELHDLQVEVARTGEKIDEISKSMTRAKKQYENDISKAAHVREKWYSVQNRILGKLDDLKEVQMQIEDERQRLCQLLRKKQSLRTENLRLKKNSRIMNNKPLLKRYDEVVEQTIKIKQCTHKFRRIHKTIFLKSISQ